MVIGFNSKSSLLDVLKTGVNELIRQFGYPEEVHFKTEGCEMTVTAAEISKRVDSWTIVFAAKSEDVATAIAEQLTAAKIPNQVEMNDGHCFVGLPAFEWRQLMQLAPVDTAVEEFAAESLRSKSWHVEVKRFKANHIGVNRIVEEMRTEGASDLHLRAGRPPFLRVDGDLKPLEKFPVTSKDDMAEFVHQLGGQYQVDILERERESTFQYYAAGVGYLRVSGYYKTGAMCLAIRLIPEEPPAFKDIELPEGVLETADAHRGLFLVCGVTGCGKSTTLAALVDYINSTRHTHIITVEDPIEFVYRDKKSIISQREVGADTHGFAQALRGALREDPDVILVGEMRDTETIRAAISAAETGHLVFSTLHTMSAVDTVNRIISYFDPGERDLVRQQLAYSLRAIVCQRLLRKKDGGRIPCVELLIGGNPIVRESIMEGAIDRLQGLMEIDTKMTTFDKYAVKLYQDGKVSKEEAVSACKDLEAFERITTGITGFQGKLLK